MKNYCEKIMRVLPSQTLAITSQAKALLASGTDVVILAAGEPDFDTPDPIKDAAIRAIKSGYTKYTPSSGDAAIKAAIVGKLLKDNELDYDPSQIVVSNGAKQSLYNVLQVLCDVGDEVVVISPYWLSYAEMVRLAGATPIVLKTTPDKGFKAGPEELSSVITADTKAVIINSPSNPAGVVYSRDELAVLGEVCLKKGVTVISDEIYEKIIYDGKKHTSIASISPEIKANTVVVNGVSKSFSMTGWRIGYAAMDKELSKLVSTLQSHATSNPCSISQAAATAALTLDMEKELKTNCGNFEVRRDLILDLLKDESLISPFRPEGAFYMFCDISGTGLSSMDFAVRLLDEAKVAVIPGGPFGEDGFVRLSFATSTDMIEKGISRIIDWVRKL